MEQRLGQNGIDDFRNHPFFEGIDWDNIGDSKLFLINISFISNIPCWAWLIWLGSTAFSWLNGKFEFFGREKVFLVDLHIVKRVVVNVEQLFQLNH